MARVGSINHQVGNIIKAHNGIRQSKLESRNESGITSLESGHKVSDKFHSYKSLDNARNDLKNLGNYAKEEFGIKDMSQINREVVANWIRDKDITYNTASNYLSEINKVHEHLNITRKEVKELRTELKADLRTNELQSRSYRHLDRIQLPEKSQPAFELQRDYGLRMSASTHINIEKQLNGNTLKYQEKGGKWSEKELNTSLVSKIRENAVEGKYELSKNTYRDHLQKEIEKSGQKYNGTHGIRHSYAQKELEAGKSKQEVSESMGHSREEITNVYLR
jgi:site-specific recombinase XerD